jgi:hypothetical protein
MGHYGPKKVAKSAQESERGTDRVSQELPHEALDPSHMIMIKRLNQNLGRGTLGVNVGGCGGPTLTESGGTPCEAAVGQGSGWVSVEAEVFEGHGTSSAMQCPKAKDNAGLEFFIVKNQFRYFLILNDFIPNTPFKEDNIGGQGGLKLRVKPHRCVIICYQTQPAIRMSDSKKSIH